MDGSDALPSTSEDDAKSLIDVGFADFPVILYDERKAANCPKRTLNPRLRYRLFWRPSDHCASRLDTGVEIWRDCGVLL